MIYYFMFISHFFSRLVSLGCVLCKCLSTCSSLGETGRPEETGAFHLRGQGFGKDLLLQCMPLLFQNSLGIFHNGYFPPPSAEAS